MHNLIMELSSRETTAERDISSLGLSSRAQASPVLRRQSRGTAIAEERSSRVWKGRTFRCAGTGLVPRAGLQRGRHFYSIAAFLLIVLFAASQLHATELADLRNGFTLRHDHHEVVG